MPRQVQEFRIFLASPGDVQMERAAVRSVVDDVNRTLGNSRGFGLKVVGWETDSRPGYGSDAQDILNQSIGQMADYDLFVGILWNRFGTETPRASSGTEEEFNRAADAHRTLNRPEIMLYAGQMLSNLSSAAELDQKRKVLDFFERVSSNALYVKYNSPAEFEAQFRRHLELWVLERLQEQPPEPPRAAADASASGQQPTAIQPSTNAATASATLVSEAAVSTDDADWALVGDGFFLTESVLEKSGDNIVLDLLPQNPDEDAVLRELQRTNQRGLHRAPAPYAYGNDGGLATVESAESKSSGGKKVWTIVLKVQRATSSPMGEAIINGITPDQAAELRAKLVLLNEPIRIGGNLHNTHDSIARMIMAPMKEKQGIFPDLWERFGERPSLFLPLARLWAIYILRASNICEHVLELRLNLTNDNKAVDVVFRGTRARVYSSRPPSSIGVDGRCLLITK